MCKIYIHFSHIYANYICIHFSHIYICKVYIYTLCTYTSHGLHADLCGPNIDASPQMSELTPHDPPFRRGEEWGAYAS